MRRTIPRLLAVLIAAVVSLIVAAAVPAGIASAHNSLSASDPADGAVLAEVPDAITWTFDKDVPLETLTVTLNDAGGARLELTGSTHGPGGSNEVVTPLPTLAAGPVGLRWRLVGPDGHPITGRVDFTIAPSPTTTVAAAVAPTTGPPSTTVAPGPDSGTGAATTPTAGGAAASTTPTVHAATDAWTTPAAARWILRAAAYVAIVIIVGLLLVSVFVWSAARTARPLRRLLRDALFATALLAVAQLLVLASDISGRPPWSSLASIDAAGATDAGMALMLRAVLAVAMWLVLFRCRITAADAYWTAVTVAGVGLLATWSFAGHSRSMRWPVLGVTADIAHHAAAAAWIAGLAVVGLVVIPRAPPGALATPVRRFSRLAGVSVAILVATGLVQGVRLVGNPTDLVGAAHGRLLLLKLAVLAVMLGVANANRRRVRSRLDGAHGGVPATSELRRAVVAELAIGLAIIGITAAMVVSPPSTSDSAAAPPTHSNPL